jgi:WD40 repeat protein
MFVGHVGDVDCCTFLPCCNYIATGGSDRTVRVWDTRSGGQARCLTGLQTGVTAVAASGDGKMLAAGCESGEVMLWDVRMERLLARLLGHSEQVTSLSFSAPHCRGAGRSASAAVALLASGSLDGTVRLWDAAVRASEPAARRARPGDADTEAEADAADGAEDVAAAGGGGGGAGRGSGSEEAVVAGPLQTLATRGAAVAAVRFSLSNLVFAVGTLDLHDPPARARAGRPGLEPAVGEGAGPHLQQAKVRC